MRWLLLVGLGLLTYGGWKYWEKDSSVGADDDNSAAFESVDSPDDPSTRESDSRDIPVPDASEEASLRQQIAGTKSPNGDEARQKLIRLLQSKRDAAATSEARQLLTEMIQGDGNRAPWAASLSFRNFEEGEARIERARAIVGMGDRAAAYVDALEALADDEAKSTTDSRQLRAWELYSKAYFAQTDEDDENNRRMRIRKKLDPIVKRIVLSPRHTSAFPIYKVKSGDSLDAIARKHKTTVATIQLVNRLPGTVIHPKQTLKILSGTVSIEVDKSEFRLDVRIGDKYLYSSPVGLGKDGGTPLGEFTIRTKMEQPTWFKRGVGEVEYGDPENPLGERWLGFEETQEYSGYGIHGTDQPDTIGTESSAGCVRMRNEDVIGLYPLIPRGTRVIIRE